MPLSPQAYRNVTNIHRQGLAADRPLADEVLEGTLYFSTDTEVLERSNTVIWEPYSLPVGAVPYVFYYRADTVSVAATDPGAGRIRWNNATQNLATALYVDQLTARDFDAVLFYKSVGPQDEVIIQDQDVSQNYQIWKLTGPVIEYPDWFEVPVAFVSSGGVGVMAHNQYIAVIIKMGGNLSGSVGPAGPPGPTGPAGATGATGPTGPAGANYTPVIQVTASTGTVNDFALTAGATVLRCNNATALTITGLSAGVAGQRLDIVSVGAGQVNLSPQNAGSVAANRLINHATLGNTCLAAGLGTASYLYDGTTARWQLVGHEQGAFITVPYTATDFTATTGTWTVDVGDLTYFSFLLQGRMLTIRLRAVTTSVSATPTQLRALIPNGHQGNLAVTGLNLINNESGAGWVGGIVDVTLAAPTFLLLAKMNYVAWTTVVNATQLVVTVTVEIV